MKLFNPAITGSLDGVVHISASGNISSSISSTGSFGHIIKGGVNWDTAVSTSAAAGGFSSGGVSSYSDLTNVPANIVSGSSQIATNISGSWKGELSSSAMKYVGGGVSGSSTSTGSFGHGYFDSKLGINKLAPIRNFHMYGEDWTTTRVYIEALSGSGAGPGIEFAFDGTGTQRGLFRLNQVGTVGTEFALYTRSTGGTLSNWLTFTSDEQVSGSSTSTGSFGHIMKGGVNWDTAVSTSAATAGFGGGGVTSYTSLTNVPANIVSGSAQIATNISGSLGANASIIRGLTNTRISGSFTDVSSSLASRISYVTDGTNISGSITSTGSFGHIMKGGVNWDTAVSASAASEGFGTGGGGGAAFPHAGDAVITGSLTISSSGYQNANSSSLQIIGGYSGSNVLDVDGSKGQLFAVSDVISGSIFSVNTVAGLPVMEAFSDNKVKLGVFAKPIIIDGSGNISGSATSTGSFGHIMKGGVNWDTAVSTSAAAGGFGPTGQNTFTSAGISGSWQSQNFSATQSFSDGTATKISGSVTSTGSFGQVKGNIVGQRPMVTQNSDFTASMAYAGHYNIVGGGLTCSILAEATASVSVGTEFEFFQTSSAGTMLFQSASLVNVYSKDGAMSITGQYSAASLKKVATNTWHLVGDLG